MHPAPRLPPSPRLRVIELVLLAAGSAALAVAMFWPLVLHLGTDIPKDLGDPLAQAWQLAWGGHALVHQPGRFFQANQFWPVPDSLALSDALVGYAPLAVPGHGVGAAIARYDLVFLLASALACAGAYLLARELGLPATAAVLAGVAFAYAPWRLEQGGHLHILSSGGIPLAAALLLRGYRRGAPALVVAGWAAMAWQVSIGFSLGLPLLVSLAAAGLLAGVAWWRRPAGARPRPRRAVVRATAAGLVLVMGVTVVLGRPYLRVRAQEPGAQRSARTLAIYSVGPRQFLVSSALNPVWGPASRGARSDLPAVAEQTLFPGLVVVLLALAGAWWAPWPRGVRRGLVAGTLAYAVLSLGFEAHGLGSLLPYRALYELVPGWSGIRVPQRLNTFTSLGLALLAAGGAAALTSRLAGSRRGLRTALPVACCVLVLAEGAGFGAGRWYPHPAPPTAPAGLAAVPAPSLQLPFRAQDNREDLLWSTAGLRPMVNGRSSVQPRAIAALLAQLGGFPDRRSVGALRRLGVRSVVLHADRLRGTPWSTWRGRPTAGLGVHRRQTGTLVVYRLG